MPQPLLNKIIPGLQLNTPSVVVLKDEYYDRKKLSVSMLRLDEIHPYISGNKLFKLYYFIEETKLSAHKTILTFGGAYSNHLAATAYACRESNLKCVGIVRGEKPAVSSPTLLFCIENGMMLRFVSRESYRHKEDESFLESLKKEYGTFILIPEGGYSMEGARGAALIPQFFNEEKFSHICLAVGTATTFAGLVNGTAHESEIVGFNVLKGLTDQSGRLEKLGIAPQKNFSFIDGYDFGGYAKKTDELIKFMNQFYAQHQIPLDFVYTGKLMFGVNNLIQKDQFPAGSNILCIHTGGLQGNQSIPAGVLNY